MRIKCLIVICSTVLFSTPSLACWPDSEDIVYPSEHMMNKPLPNIIAVRGIIKDIISFHDTDKIPHSGFHLEVKITKNFHSPNFVGDTIMVHYGPCSSLKGEMKIGEEINIIAKNTGEKSLSVINYYQYSKASSQSKD